MQNKQSEPSIDFTRSLVSQPSLNVFSLEFWEANTDSITLTKVKQNKITPLFKLCSIYRNRLRNRNRISIKNISLHRTYSCKQRIPYGILDRLYKKCWRFVRFDPYWSDEFVWFHFLSRNWKQLHTSIFEGSGKIFDGDIS